MVEKKMLILCVAACSFLSVTGTATMLATLQSNDNGHRSSQPSHLQKVEQRIVALETQLGVLENKATAQRVVSPTRERDAATKTLEKSSETQNSESDESADNTTPFIEPGLVRQQRGTVQGQLDRRTQRLISVGYAEEEAAHIVQVEERESLRQLNAQYNSRRAQLENQDAEGQNLSLLASNSLRAELGDENYQRYLTATGRPTSAAISTVISGSPGAYAGLQPGDNITSYAGRRVFDLDDVTLLTIQGEVGQNVIIEVERGGENIQLSIPRGPIGAYF